jgi:hypothetical protein
VEVKFVESIIGNSFGAMNKKIAFSANARLFQNVVFIKRNNDFNVPTVSENLLKI